MLKYIKRIFIRIAARTRSPFLQVEPLQVGIEDPVAAEGLCQLKCCPDICSKSVFDCGKYLMSSKTSFRFLPLIISLGRNDFLEVGPKWS